MSTLRVSLPAAPRGGCQHLRHAAECARYHRGQQARCFFMVPSPHCQPQPTAILSLCRQLLSAAASCAPFPRPSRQPLLAKFCNTPLAASSRFFLSLASLFNWLATCSWALAGFGAGGVGLVGGSGRFTFGFDTGVGTGLAFGFDSALGFGLGWGFGFPCRLGLAFAAQPWQASWSVLPRQR